MSSLRPNISTVTSQYLCNSCGACFASCNQAAISYIETMAGYIFPQIAPETCTRCGSCFNVCPGLDFKKTLRTKTPQDPFVGNILTCEVGRATDETIFSNSQSGGVATALLTHLFETGQIKVAIVAVMQKSSSPRGDVFLASKPEDLFQAQKSKYTPIPLLKCMHEIRQFQGGVALVGLPCHMHGLQNLLDTSPAYRKVEFYKIGLICDRVMTTKAIDFMGRKATNQSINSIVFRDKKRPAYPGNPVVYTDSGEGILLDASLRIAIKDFFTPVRCRLCFDKLNIFADVVLGDPHGVNDIDRVHGETLVLVRTVKGQSFISSAKTSGAVILRKASVDTAVRGQRIANKREEWSGYMQAWMALDKTLPSYGFDWSYGQCKSKYLKVLNHGLNLDSCISKSQLFKKANQHLIKRKVRSTILWPARKVKQIFKICWIKRKLL